MDMFFIDLYISLVSKVSLSDKMHTLKERKKSKIRRNRDSRSIQNPLLMWLMSAHAIISKF